MNRKIQLTFTDSFMDFKTLEMQYDETILDLRMEISRLTGVEVNLIDVFNQDGDLLSGSVQFCEDADKLSQLQVKVRIYIEIERKGVVTEIQRHLTTEWANGKIEDLLKLTEYNNEAFGYLDIDEEQFENEGLTLETPFKDIGERKLRFIIDSPIRECLIM